jgi:tRNA (cmo5U34)-methyltransferase
VDEWTSAERAHEYLSHAGKVPHRAEGEAVLLEMLPENVARVLDLGTGDGRLLSVVLPARPAASGLALDFSPAMLERARERFKGEGSVQIVEHDLSEPLPDLGTFDAIVSSFAIHHLQDDRKRTLYGEVFALLEPDGAFLNLERVALPTPALRRRFLLAMGRDPDKDSPSDLPTSLETQLRWLRHTGFADVDCYWKWLGLALLGGRK